MRRLQRLFLENWTYSRRRVPARPGQREALLPPGAAADRACAVQILASGPDDEHGADPRLLPRGDLHGAPAASGSDALLHPRRAARERAARGGAARRGRAGDRAPGRRLARGDAGLAHLLRGARRRRASTSSSTARRCCTPRRWSWTTRWRSWAPPTSTTAASASTSRWRRRSTTATSWTRSPAASSSTEQARIFRKRRGARVLALLESIARLSSPVL